MVTLLLFTLLQAASPPPTASELLKLGEALVQRGDGKKGQAQLEKALADETLTPAHRARGEQALGLALLQQKKAAEALAHLEKATTLAPTSEQGWLYLGLARDQQGDTAGSLAAYRKGVSTLPKSVALQHELGMALLSMGKNDEGAEVL